MTTKTMGRVLGLLGGGVFAVLATGAHAETKPEAKAAAPAALSVGKEGTFKPGILLQSWYSFTKASPSNSNTFRIRRAEISAKGDIIPGWFSWGVMFDPAKLLEFQDTKLAVSPTTNMASVTAKQPAGSSSLLQDVFVTMKFSLAEVSLGQFKNPVSWEGYNSASKILFHERSQVAVRFGDKRDLGLRLTKTWKYAGYTAGLFNGTGQNARDADKSKDGALRLELYPLEGMTAAGVVYATLWERSAAGAKDRYEADLRYERGPVLFQGEWIYARDVNKDLSKTRASGFYTAAAGRIIPELQLAARLGYLNPDKTKQEDHTWAYEAILNYYLRGQEARLSLAYGNFRPADPTKSPETTVVFAAQASF